MNKIVLVAMVILSIALVSAVTFNISNVSYDLTPKETIMNSKTIS